MNLALDNPLPRNLSFLLCGGADPACLWHGPLAGGAGRITCVSAPPHGSGGRGQLIGAPGFLGEGFGCKCWLLWEFSRAVLGLVAEACGPLGLRAGLAFQEASDAAWPARRLWSGGPSYF